ncbi:hypothetical protein L211DRAFT_280831 [Terfezia boudieri ATCC MYA-4762]|uniref:Secreted protein n=1 Tax=Terfezia boudieri ATCC MYA-4762 TaxID=1051890 RepID=A0A3N4LKG4_9PEZI|nr:hypothetical protein L211DRAFT_280831 [Terfezia boudieri ATCC MYA-4762]
MHSIEHLLSLVCILLHQLSLFLCFCELPPTLTFSSSLRSPTAYECPSFVFELEFSLPACYDLIDEQYRDGTTFESQRSTVR